MFMYVENVRGRDTEVILLPLFNRDGRRMSSSAGDSSSASGRDFFRFNTPDVHDGYRVVLPLLPRGIYVVYS